MDGIEQRVAALPWQRIAADLDGQGWACTGPLLRGEECDRLRALYDRDALFRSRITMARHGFGEGEYGYLAYPLPPLVASLRHAFYPPLAVVANGWAARQGEPGFPATLEAQLQRCRAAGQTRPTPLLLRYRAGDHNCLHQDRYGPELFPLQLVLLLSRPGLDFTGGELVLVEQRPRRQSRAEVVTPVQGEGVIFAVHHRPAASAGGGGHKVTMRHGVSRVRSGERMTAGLIFHDAA